MDGVEMVMTGPTDNLTIPQHNNQQAVLCTENCFILFMRNTNFDHLCFKRVIFKLTRCSFQSNIKEVAFRIGGENYFYFVFLY